VDNSNNSTFPFAINTLCNRFDPYNLDQLLYRIWDNFLRRLLKRACSEWLNTLYTYALTRAYPQGRLELLLACDDLTSRSGKGLEERETHQVGNTAARESTVGVLAGTNQRSIKRRHRYSAAE
jgi:hypothetical protein